jgi:cytidyltransferase-like protein
MKKIVLVTGGFDPLHSGHLAYFRAAKALGDRLIVGVNSDAWLTRKKGRPFMPVWERAELIQNLKMVDQVVFFDDRADADGSAKHFIKETLELFPDHEIIFANGGDRTDKNIPEMEIQDPRLSFVFGVGGHDKGNSSSWILEEWKAPKTERPWGYYRVLHEVPGTKVKELTVNPKQSLSLQRHAHRNEYWHVTSGRCDVYGQLAGGYTLPPKTLDAHENRTIPRGEWHKLTNPYDEPCKIVEIQYGDACDESDIERRE